MPSRIRRLAGLVAILILSLAVPTNAHVNNKVNHVWSHLRQRALNLVTWTNLQGVPAGFSDNTDNIGDTWAGLTGIPAGFSDNTDNIGDTWAGLTGIPADISDGDDVGGPGGLAAYCALLAEPANYAPCATITTTVDSSADVGYGYTSLAIGADGDPVVSYFDNTTDDLRVAKCSDPSCTGGVTLTTVDATNEVGNMSSIAIGTDGNPVVAYRDETSDDLKVVKCNDPACTGSGETITAVETTGNVGENLSLAIGTDGNPVISYRDGTDLFLQVTKCNDPACTGGGETTTDVVAVGTQAVDDPGIYTSIAIGTDTFPVIAYRHSGNKDLMVAKCNDTACAGQDETVSVVDATTDSLGRFSSIAIGADGNPTIAYRNDGGILKVVHCNDTACAGGETLNNVQFEGDAGYSASIALGIDGNPIISYHAASGAFNDLRVVQCNDVACAGGYGNDPFVAVDTAGEVGSATSIVMGVDGVAVISYYDGTNSNLKVARVP